MMYPVSSLFGLSVSEVLGIHSRVEYVGFMNLPEDVQVLVLTYLDIIDLYRVSCSCKQCAYLILSNDCDDFLWREIALRYGIQEGEETDEHSEFMSISPVSPTTPAQSSSFRARLLDLFSTFVVGSSREDEMIRRRSRRRKLSLVVERENSLSTCILLKEKKELTGMENIWRRRVKHGTNFCWDPDARTPDSTLVLSNYNKTVSNNRSSKWDTIRANYALKNPLVYYWEYILVRHDNSDFNSYRIFVGVERSTYEFTTVGFDKIIGFNSYGIGYNIGEHSIHRNFQHSLANKSRLAQDANGKFKTGDIITVRFDLTRSNSCEKPEATMDMFKNGQWFLTIDDIPTLDEYKRSIIYYPAISLIGKQTVTLKRGVSFKQFQYPQSKS